MRKTFLGLAAVAALALSSAANASIVIGTNNAATDPYSGPAPTYDFDGSVPPTSGGAVVPNTDGLNHSRPVGSTGNFYAVGPHDTSPGTIDLSAIGDIFNISILWGSIDGNLDSGYNVLDFLAADGTTVLQEFHGPDVSATANGCVSCSETNRVVQFLLSGSDVSAFTYLKLSSSQNAFEIDNIAVNAGVPEPATWALMLLGFGGIGLAMRRRRNPVLAQIA